MNRTPTSAVALARARPVQSVRPAQQVSVSDPLLTPKQVMELLDVSRWWIDKYSTREHDPLPWIGTPRKRLILRSALLDWMARN